MTRASTLATVPGPGEPVELTAREARRLAVRAQLLDLPRPAEVLEVIRHLGFLQVDLTDHVSPSADLVLAARLGRGYRPAQLERLLDDGVLVERARTLRPIEDVALLRGEMQRWPGPEPLQEWQIHQVSWVRANDDCRREILEILRTDGPTAPRDLPDTCEVPWRSTGWTHEANVQRLIGFMADRGEVAIAGRTSRGPLYDLAERVYPDDEVVPADAATTILDARRLAALGIARSHATAVPNERNDVGHAGVEAVVAGVRGRWRIDIEVLESLRNRPFRGRAAILSPLDRLVYDRKRMVELFGFDYQLEMYKPRAKRRWGYYALPVLYADDLIGKVDAQAEHAQGVLRVDAIHQDQPWSRTCRSAVEAELRALAECLDLELRLPGV